MHLLPPLPHQPSLGEFPTDFAAFCSEAERAIYLNCSSLTPLRSDTQILKYIAKLTLLEHGLVTEADRIDQLHLRAAVSAGPSKGAAAKAADATLSDQEEGESTEEPGETIDEFKERIGEVVRKTLARFGQQGRDEYKRSGNVYDRRKKVIAEFLKSLTKKKCEHCGA